MKISGLVTCRRLYHASRATPPPPPQKKSTHYTECNSLHMYSCKDTCTHYTECNCLSNTPVQYVCSKKHILTKSEWHFLLFTRMQAVCFISEVLQTTTLLQMALVATPEVIIMVTIAIVLTCSAEVFTNTDTNNCSLASTARELSCS